MTITLTIPTPVIAGAALWLAAGCVVVLLWHMLGLARLRFDIELAVGIVAWPLSLYALVKKYRQTPG